MRPRSGFVFPSLGLLLLATAESALANGLGGGFAAAATAGYLVLMVSGVVALAFTVAALCSRRHCGWLWLIPGIYVAYVFLGSMEEGSFDLWNPWYRLDEGGEHFQLHLVVSLLLIANLAGGAVVVYKAVRTKPSLTWFERLCIADALIIILLLEYVLTAKGLGFP